MLKLNRTTEYGLLALQHISKKGDTNPRTLTSAREIADHYGLPFEILAKTLQRLKEKGLIHSEQGARGGYSLGRALETVSLGEFIELMEGPQAVVPCGTGSVCDYHGKCEIRGMMGDLNHRLQGFLSGIRIADLTRSHTP